MRTSTKLLVGLVGIALATACGGGAGGAPPSPELHPDLVLANVFGGEVPASAQSITPEAFSARLADGSLTLVTRDLIAQQQEDERDQMEADRARAEELFVGRMDVLQRLTTEPAPDDPEFEPLEGGGWRVKAVEADPRTGRKELRVVVDGTRHAYAELVAVTERYRSRDNQIGLYRELFGRLNPTFIDRHDLPEPDTLTIHSFEELEALNLKIANLWGTLEVPPAGPPPGYPSGPAAEEGYGGGIDYARYGSHDGMWPSLDFPLKWYATSVKWQGSRGSCVAFGITAAVETVVARDQSRWVNLSEQMLYNRAKQIWWPSTFGDGLNTGGTLGTMLLYLYRYSWEASWDYNVSQGRIEIPPLNYFNSCGGNEDYAPYGGEHCSEANHQAPLFKTVLPFGTICGYLDPAQVVAPDAKFLITKTHALGEPGLLALVMAKVSLTLKIPVVISVTVPETLRGDFVKDDGIVTYLGGLLGTGGGHCMLLVGYVANADLPPGTPPGAGGGYFICKNSWSNSYGDGGYCYLPDSWVLTWARSLYTLNSVGEL